MKTCQLATPRKRSSRRSRPLGGSTTVIGYAPLLSTDRLDERLSQGRFDRLIKPRDPYSDGARGPEHCLRGRHEMLWPKHHSYIDPDQISRLCGGSTEILPNSATGPL